jgi:hypothetical protein
MYVISPIWACRKAASGKSCRFHATVETATRSRFLTRVRDWAKSRHGAGAGTAAAAAAALPGAVGVVMLMVDAAARWWG